MSTVRFIHTDFLRLGTPLSGLSDCPGWLHQLATGAVRQSVANVIELAVAQDAAFVLIAGGITDSQEDLTAAVNWLDEQFLPLRARGIRVIARSDDSVAREALNRICDLVLYEDQHIDVAISEENGVEISSSREHSYSPVSNFTIGFDDAQTFGDAPDSVATGRMTYQVQPSLAPSMERSQATNEGWLRLSAGAVQAVNHDETWECGCFVVDADTSSRQLRATFVETDTIRFQTEILTLPNSTDSHTVVPEIVQASEPLARRSSRTVIVDWVVGLHLTTDLSSVEELDEYQLLSQLRHDLQSGHRGVWPRRVTFAESADLQLRTDQTAAIEEYVDIEPGLADTDAFLGRPNHHLTSGIRPGVSPELVSGLTLLARAA